MTSNRTRTRPRPRPFGGWKQSGIGKELGLVDDILSHIRSKAMSVAVTPGILP